MDLMNYLISVTIIALAIRFGVVGMALGATLILIVASKEVKASLLMVISYVVFYVINGIGMKDYWFFGVLGLILLGYLFGFGKEEAPADPYAGLLGGGGMEGMM